MVGRSLILSLAGQSPLSSGPEVSFIQDGARRRLPLSDAGGCPSNVVLRCEILSLSVGRETTPAHMRHPQPLPTSASSHYSSAQL